MDSAHVRRQSNGLGDGGSVGRMICGAVLFIGGVVSFGAAASGPLMDFGDAPTSYPTLLAQDGARHVIVPGYCLGSRIDAEPDGQPNDSATGDDAIPSSMSINLPVSIAGEYPTGGAAFGPDVPLGGITADVAYYTTNPLGRSDLGGFPAGYFAGKIALIDRGVCMFVEKVKNAQNAGALAVIVVNSSSTSGVITMGGSDPSIAIPARMVSYETGAAIKANLPLPGVNATLLEGIGIDDEDGILLTGLLYPGAQAVMEVTATSSGLLDAWIDFNSDGDWDDPGEQILAGEPVSTETHITTITVPLDAAPNMTFSRFRFSSAGGLSYAGLASDGEVEDHWLAIPPHLADLIVTKTCAAQCVMAGEPFDYLITVANSGPSTASQVGVYEYPVYLLTCLSSAASQGGYDPAARLWTVGDLDPGATATLTLTFETTCSRTTWFFNTAHVTGFVTDLNPDNDWSDVLTVTIPGAPDGFDFGDAPTSYPTLLARDGARHAIAPGLFLGQRVDREDDGQPADWADGDDRSSACLRVNAPPDIAGEYAALAPVFGPAAPIGGITLDMGYYSKNPTGSTALGGFPAGYFTGKIALIDRGQCLFVEKVKNAQLAGAAGVVVDNSVPGGGLIWMGGSDQSIAIPSVFVSYETGQAIKEKLGEGPVNTTLLTPGGVDDEDGVAFLSLLYPGEISSLRIDAFGNNGRLDGWVDFNGDGDWDDPGEKVFANARLTSGSNTTTFTVPLDAAPNATGTFARFRFSSAVVGLSPNGLAPDGEVEDYLLRLYPPIADLATTKTASAPQVFAGEPLTYHIAAGNAGPRDAKQVVVSDFLTTAVAYRSSDASAGDYDPATGYWTVGELAAGATATLTITVDVDAAASGPIVNRASVSGYVTDLNGWNDSSLVETLAVGTPPGSLDFGDAPAPFPTLLADNGARHYIVPGFFLGERVDGEADGQPTGAASGDDTSGTRLRVSAPLDIAGDYDTLLAAFGPIPPAGGVTADAAYYTTDPMGIGGFPAGFFAGKIALVDRGMIDFSEKVKNAQDAGALGVIVANHIDGDLIVMGRGTPAPITIPSIFVSRGTGLALKAGMTMGTVNATILAEGGDDDEDGVAFQYGALFPGEDVPLFITASAAGKLDGWIDFNGDGGWGGGDEQVFASVPLAEGVNVVFLSVPFEAALATPGTCCRFRFSSAGGLSYTGLASDGEVEDYRIPVIPPYADLIVSKTVSAETVKAGESLDYLITIGNHGPLRARQVAVDDSPPAGVVYVSSDASMGSYDPPTGEWAVGELERGATATLRLRVTVDWMTSGPVVNTASVMGFVTDLNESNNVASAVTQVNGFDFDFGDAPAPFPTLLAQNGARHIIVPGFHLGQKIEGEKNGQPTDAADGDDMAGIDDEDGVAFAGPLSPGETSLVSVSASGAGKLDGWIDFNANGDWNDPGEQVFDAQTLTTGITNLSIPTPLGAALSSPGVYARFRFSSDGGLPVDGMALDGEVEDYRVPVIPPMADLVVTKTASLTSVKAGASFAYTIVVANAGPGTARTVKVLDALPAGLTLQSSDASQGSYSQSKGSWTVGDLTPGTTATLGIDVMANASTSGTVVNAAAVSGDVTETHAADNASTVTTVVIGVTPISSLEVLNHLLGGPLLTGAKLAAADVNQDGKVDAADLIALIKQGK